MHQLSLIDLHVRTHACAGTTVSGHEDGVHQEPLLLHAVAGDVRPRRRPVHRVRAAVHAVLAARAAVAPHLARAGARRRQDDPQRGPRRPRQGAGQRHQEEEGVVMRVSGLTKQLVLCLEIIITQLHVPRDFFFFGMLRMLLACVIIRPL